tara:strand:- start:422 stop:712 length:291 start_codon:yes stop_codon:yes gene_type:complete
MESILFFLIFSGIWAVADAVMAPPIAKLFGISIEVSECIVGSMLGAIGGFYFGPIIAFSIEQKVSSWIATICLIVFSFIFSIISNIVFSIIYSLSY